MARASLAASVVRLVFLAVRNAAPADTELAIAATAAVKVPISW